MVNYWVDKKDSPRVVQKVAKKVELRVERKVLKRVDKKEKHWVD